MLTKSTINVRKNSHNGLNKGKNYHNLPHLKKKDKKYISNLASLIQKKLTYSKLLQMK